MNKTVSGEKKNANTKAGQGYRVGILGVPTWNKLQMNEGLVKTLPAHPENVETSFQGLPNGVAHFTISSAQVETYIKNHAPSQPAELIVAGKTPIHHPQAFATGLGKEFADYAKEASGEDITHLVSVEKDTRISDPILWGIRCENGGESITRQLIHVKENAEIVLIMTAESPLSAKGFSGISTRIILEKGANMILVRAQMLGKGFQVMDDIGASLEEDARLKVVHMELGGREVFTGVHAELIGKRARFENRAGYLAERDSSFDMTVNVIHRGKESESEIAYDGVLKDRARKILRDTIDFRSGAGKAKGDEQENVLLLSDDVENKSMPVILCEEEDMEGRHGATIGRLDEDMLFYLTTRGIDPEEAARMMVRARLQAVARHIPDHATEARIYNYIDGHAG